MKSASEVLKSREEKRQQRLKENQEQINKELLEFEKALNKYESNIGDNKPYITVDTIIKTDEVKSLLKQNGYYIDKVSNDIEVNTTRVYLNQKDYDIAIKGNYFLNKLSNKEKEDNKIRVNSTENIAEDSLDLVELLNRIGLLNNCQRRYC